MLKKRTVFWKKYIDQKFCNQNGLSSQQSLNEFTKQNKKYYQKIEDYDWVKVTDKLQGPEAILHRLREKKTLELLTAFSQSGRFLDVGCGTGLILRHLPPGSVGIDINPRNIKRAKKYAPQAELVLGDIEKMPFNDRTFSLIICTEVLEHLITPQIALKEMFRVLKRNGILIGSVPICNPIWHLRFLSSTHPGEPYHRLYQKKEIETLFNQQKREILKLEKSCFGMNLFFIVQK